jgi:hypothetical protein
MNPVHILTTYIYPFSYYITPVATFKEVPKPAFGKDVLFPVLVQVIIATSFN